MEVWIPIVAAEAEEVERSRRKTWSTGRIQGFRALELNQSSRDGAKAEVAASPGDPVGSCP